MVLVWSSGSLRSLVLGSTGMKSNKSPSKADESGSRISGCCQRNCFRWDLTRTCALSLQFCTELNQPILPNIRKWKGPRGCWKAVVAETPSAQLQKVPTSAQLGFSFHFIETAFFPNRRHLKFSFANILDAILYFCPFF